MFGCWRCLLRDIYAVYEDITKRTWLWLDDWRTVRKFHILKRTHKQVAGPDTPLFMPHELPITFFFLFPPKINRMSSQAFINPKRKKEIDTWSGSRCHTNNLLHFLGLFFFLYCTNLSRFITASSALSLSSFVLGSVLWMPFSMALALGIASSRCFRNPSAQNT